MRFTFDPVADAAYIGLLREIRPRVVARTDVVDLATPGAALIVDFDADDRLVGIEMLNATRLLSPEVLAKADRRSGVNAAEGRDGERQWSFEIDADQLKRACDALIDHVASTRGSIRLTEDYYWSVPTADRFRMDREPKKLTIGQLTECWSNVEWMLTDDRTIGYGLVWLGEVLKAIGEAAVG